METPSDIVRKLAREVGFDLVGIAEATPLDEESANLREWLSRGYHATMSWMERNLEKRADPSKVLDGARSVISLAKNYYTPVDHDETPAAFAAVTPGSE
ncbi:MAG: tRNA epoxyqueuosine(34) reductase QueG, partial [Bacteroidetes bacterium]|nr:tRNA epoxyqueuosine(34) reductase QueG [Bacteroidota bacterium]